MNNYFLGLNWKTNPATLEEANLIVDGCSYAFEINRLAEVAVFGPDVYLPMLMEKMGFESINGLVGSQDISAYGEGASTGEVSANMLANMGIKYALIGHSETRKINNLSNQQTNHKVIAALNARITPVLCIGFQQDINQSEINLQELEQQMLEGLSGIPEIFGQNFGAKVIVAYEPVWAIGTGKTADNQTISKVLDYLRQRLTEFFGENVSRDIFLAYGGSVSSQNISELMQIPQLQGFLVGGASLKPEEVTNMLQILNEQGERVE